MKNSNEQEIKVLHTILIDHAKDIKDIFTFHAHLDSRIDYLEKKVSNAEKVIDELEQKIEEK